MKLYICADGSYAGTQADAKAKGKGWQPEEVPVDKQGLIDYLNTNRHLHELECPEPSVHADEGNDEHIPVLPPASAPSFRAPKPDDPAEQFVDWLYDEASPSYIADLFGVLSSRFTKMAAQLKALS